jgi:MYXO-CTERM domain-containing protein
VVSVDGTKASIKVEFAGGGSGAPTCIDGTAFTGSGPGPESCAAAPAVPSGAPPAIPDGGAMPPPMVRDGGAGTKLDARPEPTGGAGGEGGGGGTGGSEGSGGAAGGGKLDAATSPGTVGGGTNGPGEPKTAVKGGCGCFVGGQQRPTPLVLLALAIFVWRRRR